jgi:hypothetical protein
MKRQELFTKKRVVVMKYGVIVERYPNLNAFVRAYPLASYNCISQRVRNCLDGWMPDGKTARYYCDADKPGRPLVMSKIRDRDEEIDEKKQWKKDLAETETKIKAAYDACDRGEITFEERHAQIGWLQNHAAVLRQRLGIRKKNKED